MAAGCSVDEKSSDVQKPKKKLRLRLTMCALATHGGALVRCATGAIPVAGACMTEFVLIEKVKLRVPHRS